MSYCDLKFYVIVYFLFDWANVKFAFPFQLQYSLSCLIYFLFLQGLGTFTASISHSTDYFPFCFSNTFDTYIALVILSEPSPSCTITLAPSSINSFPVCYSLHLSSSPVVLFSEEEQSTWFRVLTLCTHILTTLSARTRRGRFLVSADDFVFWPCWHPFRCLLEATTTNKTLMSLY